MNSHARAGAFAQRRETNLYRLSVSRPRTHSSLASLTQSRTRSRTRSRTGQSHCCIRLSRGREERGCQNMGKESNSFFSLSTRSVSPSCHIHLSTRERSGGKQFDPARQTRAAEIWLSHVRGRARAHRKVDAACSFSINEPATGVTPPGWGGPLKLTTLWWSSHTDVLR